MPRPLAQGRPGTPLIPLTWEADHAVVAVKQMTATVSISRRDPNGTPTWNPLTHTSTVPGISVWSGVARIQGLNAAAGAQSSADERITSGDYRVSIPRSVTPVQIGDRVTVTASHDGSLTGRTLTVTDIRRGSILWQRDLTCTDDETEATP